MGSNKPKNKGSFSKYTSKAGSGISSVINNRNYITK
jgi:hypothetical protein